MINIDDRSTWPAYGSRWMHRNGNTYVVMNYANKKYKLPKYPVTIIYYNLHTEEVYTRPLADWERSMTPTETR